MAVLRRPSTNYVPGAGIAIAKADNPGLDAVDVTIRELRELMAVWAGPVPTVAGPGLEFTVPQVRGVSVTFALSRLFTRLSVLPAGTTTFRIEKSAGGGAFSAAASWSLSHTTTDWEKSTTSFSGATVSSGDIVRLYFVAVNGNGGQYQVQLEGDES